MIKKMKYRILFLLPALAVCIVLSYYAGYKYSQRGFCVYRMEERVLPFPKDDCLYNLPIDMYLNILQLINQEKYSEAREFIAIQMEDAQKKAKARAAYINNDDRDKLLKMLNFVNQK